MVSVIQCISVFITRTVMISIAETAISVYCIYKDKSLISYPLLIVNPMFFLVMLLYVVERLKH